MKNYRRIIPAFALLLVTAIMLSTASYAWFTATDKVSATGMNVQAQASGSLVIKKNSALLATDADITVSFADVGTKQLIPVTYKEQDGEQAAGWYNKADTAVIDPLTGSPDAALSLVDTYTPTNTMYVDHVVYIASAGDKMDNMDILVNVLDEATTKEKVSEAYTVAFYINTDPATTAPTAIVNVRDGDDTTAPVKITTGDAVTIPSTVGVTETGVGIKITMRVYVDGALPGTVNKTVQVPTYASAAGQTYNATKVYYQMIDEAGELVASNMKLAPTHDLDDGVSAVPAGYYTVTYTSQSVPSTVVNNADAPTAPTALTITFKAQERT